jgi:putative spermidine/putrescine transport system permease protein
MEASMSLAMSTEAPSHDRFAVSRRTLLIGLLLGPCFIFLVFAFAIPVANMVKYSVYALVDGKMEPALTLESYAHFFGEETYRRVLVTTLRIAVVTTLIAAVLACPTALVMTRAHPVVSRIVSLIIIAPLLVNVVIRTYGWRTVLGNNGIVNWSLINLGVISEPLHLLYTETAIVIGSLHVFFPMMVLPVAATLARVDRNLEDAARTLGANELVVFFKVTLPLMLPGIAAGMTLIFSLTAGSYVLPTLLGGDFTKMLGTLVEQQILATYNWPFGAAIATILMGLVLTVVMLHLFVFERRLHRYRLNGREGS